MSVWMSSLGVGAELALELASSPAQSARGSVAGFPPGSHGRNVPEKVPKYVRSKLLKASRLSESIVGCFFSECRISI